MRSLISTKKIIKTIRSRPVIFRLFFTVIGFLFLITDVHAANRFWIGVGLLGWNNTANWSTTSGGLPGATVPGSADAVIFDNAGVANCNIDAAVNVTSITTPNHIVLKLLRH